MNERDSKTRNYQTGTHLSRSEILRRRKQKQLVLVCVCALLAVLLVLALVMVAINLGFGDETTDLGGSGATPEEKHEIAHAYDGDAKTYAVCGKEQRAGAYMIFTLGENVDIGGVGIVSAHTSDYIRSADVELSPDGTEWTKIGTFIASTNDSSEQKISLETTVAAKYVRIVLTSDADAAWVVNELTVYSASGKTVSIDSAMISAGSGSSAGTGDASTVEPEKQYNVINKTGSDLGAGTLVLVDALHVYKFPPSEIKNVVNLYGNFAGSVADNTYCLLNGVAFEKLNALALELGKQTGNAKYLIVQTNGGYRSYETQAALYEKYKDSAAEVGYTDHHTGYGVNLDLFIDSWIFSFDEQSSVTERNAIITAARTWITANAADYGFVRRYPPEKSSVTGVSSTSDAWHFRYVGYPHAKIMAANNYCLEEYLVYLQNFTFEGSHLEWADGTNSYEIYYVAADKDGNAEIKVPIGANYEISGDNYSGYIVTVKK